MKLFHFTSRYHIKGCLREGLTKGGIPEIIESKLFHIFNYQWLTSNPSFEQGWEKPSGILKYRRNEYRITVKIPKAKRENLIKWTDYIKEHELNITEHLNAFGGHEDWWLFHGIVKPKWFREVVENPWNNFKP